jgi:ABC-type amino acid transport substrate-binding protein
MKRFLLCLVMVLYGCTCADNANAESFVVGLMNADRPPYFWRDETGGYRGLFIDVLDGITKETDLHFSYKALPKARIRLYMVVGKIDVEMGVATEWRKKKAEIKNSVYSIPFMESKEVYVTSSKQGSFDSEQYIPVGDKFCGILGFSKPEGSSGKSRVDFLSEKQLLKMIDKRRCDYTVMPEDVFRYLQLGNTYNVVASEPISTHAMRVRLTRQHEWLLPRINAALLRMKDSGRLAIILDRYK